VTVTENARPSTTPTSNGWSALNERLPRGRRRRRPVLVMAGVVLVACGAVVSASLVARAHSDVSVLALARPVTAGEVVSAADLRVVHVSGAGVSALSAAGAGALVGATALASLTAGTLLAPGMVARFTPPGPGNELVAVGVKPGLVPPQVAAGRSVSLIDVAAGGANAAPRPSVLVRSAKVVAVTQDAATGQIVLSVVVPGASAPLVAQASASGTVAVSVLPVGS
jgi:hypothetical protein